MPTSGTAPESPRRPWLANSCVVSLINASLVVFATALIQPRRRGSRKSRLMQYMTSMGITVLGPALPAGTRDKADERRGRLFGLRSQRVPCRPLGDALQGISRAVQAAVRARRRRHGAAVHDRSQGD